MKYKIQSLCIKWIVFLFLIISTNSFSQYQRILDTPYPRRIAIMDSVVVHEYHRSENTFATNDSNVKQIIEYVRKNGNRFDVLNIQQQRLNNIYTWVLGRNKGYPSFLQEANQLLSEVREINYKVIEARTLSMLGQYYFSIENNYKLAFENLIKSKEIYQTLSIIEYPEKAYSYYVIAYLYYEFSDFESALKITRELEKLEKVDYNKQLLNYDLMGECYVNLMKYDSARLCFEKVLELIDASELDKLTWTGIAKGKIGETWFYMNDLVKAETLLQEGIRICDSPGIDLSDNVNVFAAKLSKIYLEWGKDSLAYHFAALSRESAQEYDKAGFVFKRLKAYKFHLNYLKAFSEYYKVQSDFKNAFIYTDSFLMFQDKIQHQLDIKQKYNAQIAIDNENDLKREVVEKEEKLKQSFIRKSLIALVVILIFASLLLYDRLLQKQKSKEQKYQAEHQLKEKELLLEQQAKINEIEKRKFLEAKNVIIEQSLYDKELLMKEIHHRVKNNLQIISSLLELQGNRMTDPAMKAIIEEGRGRVMSISLIHQQLYQKDDFRFVEMKPFISELSSQISSSLISKDLDIEFKYDIDPCLIHIDVGIPLGILINELLTNSLKYAFVGKNKGTIFIQLKCKDAAIPVESAKDCGLYENQLCYFEYRDSGPGLPEDVDFQKARSLGLKLITQLSKQIHGTPAFEKVNGLVFQLQF